MLEDFLEAASAACTARQSCPLNVVSNMYLDNHHDCISRRVNAPTMFPSTTGRRVAAAGRSSMNAGMVRDGMCVVMMLPCRLLAGN